MAETRPRLAELTRVFARLGFTAFGGPAVHIAMMRDEFVRRRRWLPEQEFLDLLGAANLIPGPTSTELAIYLGYRWAGWAGLAAAGCAFILPAVAIVLACAWAYVTYGTLPAVGRIFYGVTPVLIAIIALALWGLARTAIKDAVMAVAAAAATALALAGTNVLALLLLGGAAAALARRLLPWRAPHAVASALIVPRGDDAAGPARTALAAGPVAAAAGVAASVSLGTLFLTFLKVGAVLFGSGYVLLAFLRQDLVVRFRWLTDRQLLDAIAIGQFTPGPVFTTATFIGYVLAGLPGAAVATVGIFLPSFVFVAATYPIARRLRASPWTAAFLDGVNAIAVALMVSVTWSLARTAIVDPLTLALGIGALGVLVRTRVNSAWLILAGGAVGFLLGGGMR